MSISSAQSRVDQTQREIRSLNSKLAAETKKEADRTDKIGRAKQALGRTSSASIIQSKLREIERYERDVAQIQRRKADLSKQIADKTARLHSNQQHLAKEQTRDQQKFMDSLKQQQRASERERAALLSELSRATAGDAPARLHTSGAMHDAFISHASEDKEELVRPLADKLVAGGLSIWYDEFELTVGDSLRRSIDRGLARSRFGIVILSPHFFAKSWTQYELDGLVTREISDGGKVILPLWHHISKDEVRSYSPSLADKVALSTALYTIDELVEQLIKAIRRTAP
jgi:hypothetical protein